MCSTVFLELSSLMEEQQMHRVSDKLLSKLSYMHQYFESYLPRFYKICAMQY